MRISLRGDRNSPTLCYEVGSNAYSVESAIKRSRTQLGRFADTQIAALADLAWNQHNFLATPGLWQALHALGKAIDEAGEWPALDASVAGLPYLPPILDPPLFFGLAGNCPMTWRQAAKAIPNYPVGYTRTCHTLTGHLGRVRLPEAVTSFRCAVELGVVIGRTARNVSRQDAMQYVAGYTIVNDMISNHWKDFATEHCSSDTPGFEELLITSYYGRGTAGFAPFGPYIVDRADIDNPYDLMMYSKINGVMIDRSHTNAMVVGIDTAIEYFSRYCTLEPGSIIHMGTMGLDGITLAADQRLGREDYVELEIERIGSIRVYFDDLRRSAR